MTGATAEGILRGRALHGYSTAKPCSDTGAGMHCEGGNVNWATRIRQVFALFSGRYPLTYQNV
jgi:hypothetical protein